MTKDDLELAEVKKLWIAKRHELDALQEAILKGEALTQGLADLASLFLNEDTVPIVPADYALSDGRVFIWIEEDLSILDIPNQKEYPQTRFSLMEMASKNEKG